MQIKKPMLALTAFLALVAVPFAAEAQPGRALGDVLRNPRALARYLKLTPAQIATTKGLQQELKAAVEPLRETQKSLREALKAELGAASPNACAVGEAALAVHDNREKIRAEIEEFDEELSAILTPAQLARYEALKEAVRPHWDGEDD